MEEELKKAEAALNSIERKFINDEIAADTYKRQKTYYDTQLRQLSIQVEEVGLLRKELVQHLSSALNLINNADYYYQLSSPEMKNLLVSSIFCKKLVFDNGKYQTPENNEVITRITSSYKAEKVTVSGDLSLTVARTGLLMS